MPVESDRRLFVRAVVGGEVSSVNLPEITAWEKKELVRVRNEASSVRQGTD